MRTIDQYRTKTNRACMMCSPETSCNCLWIAGAPEQMVFLSMEPVSNQTLPQTEESLQESINSTQKESEQLPVQKSYWPLFLGSTAAALLSILLVSIILTTQKNSVQSVSIQPDTAQTTNHQFLGNLSTVTQKAKNTISKLGLITAPSKPLASKSIETHPTTTVVDTNQTFCFSDTGVITCGQSFAGQDAEYTGVQAKYQDNGDGTITDLNTGLMWLQDAGDKLTYSQAISKLTSFSYAGYDDWRAPTIKELYSLMDFSGQDISENATESTAQPFMNDDFFVFKYGDLAAGDRIIDSQWVTSSLYVSKVMNNQSCFFGVNFADGRIKCYPTGDSGKQKTYYARYVRGNSGYGENNFVDNGDTTVSDTTTTLMWQKNDSGTGMDWGHALQYCENLSQAGHSDWRLPNAKELHSIVDYTRSPDTTNSPALDPIFETSTITNEKNQLDYPFYWTSTTHDSQRAPDSAVYISFGRCLGAMNGELMDVHGAGCQRSDPKTGDPNDYPQWGGKAPQGDVVRVFNYVRCVRGGEVRSDQGSNPSSHPGYISAPAQPQETLQDAPTAPAEAQAACAQKASGSTCSFMSPTGNISGTCINTPNGALACVPQK